MWQSILGTVELSQHCVESFSSSETEIFKVDCLMYYQTGLVHNQCAKYSGPLRFENREPSDSL